MIQLLRLSLCLLAFFAGCKCANEPSPARPDAGPAKRVRAAPPPGPCANLAACLQACERGEPRECYEASRLWVDPADGGRDLTGAQRLAGVACEKGDGRGCVRAGALPTADAGQLAEFSRAAGRLLPQQCDAGELEACELLFARLRELDAGVEAATAASRARTLATRACEGGDSFSCARLGSALLSGRLGTEEPGEGARLLDKACEGGVAGACLELGLALVKGRPGLAPDPARAVRLRSAARELSAP
ncbi:MAG: hypothetical protein Q8L48_08160 [Archangium sp.]|nr:hypothetical protein [Archangium sp.]